MEQRSDVPGDAWREITVAEGNQGPRSYRFSAQRVPGEIHWAIYRRNLDGSEDLSNAPEDMTLAYVGGSRWRIETESRRRRAMWDRVRDPHLTGWHHHVALCLWLEPFS